MATQVQIRRGSTSEHASFTGAVSEITVDTTKKTVVVHDGTTAGGAPLMRENGAQALVTTGTSTAASFIPTSSTVPSNGLYLSGTNTVALATASTGRLYVDASGNVGVGGSPSVQFQVTQNQATYSYFDFYNTTAGGGIVWRQIVRNIANTSTTSIDFVKYLAGGFGIVNNDTNAANFTAFNVGASERARIDSSGRLLVGTSSYTGNSKLAVAGGAGTDVALLDLRFGGSRPTTADSGVSEIRFGSPDQTSNNAYAKIECITDGASSSNTDIPARLVFSVTRDGQASPTEALRITSNGTSRAFSAADSYTLELRNGSTSGTSTALLAGYYGSTDNSSGTNSIFVATNGNVQNANNSYGAISDIKLKENIVDANSQWDDLKALQVRNYNFKEGQTHTQIGLVAQEVEAVSPGLVSESPDRDADGNDLGTVTKSVNYSVLYMKAVKALQEAMERIETLEAKVAALERV